MSETAFEPVPAVEPAEPPAAAGTLVMKFGGTSVADPEKIRRVAARLVAAKRAGNRVVAVVSAMGQHTDELVSLAHEVSPAARSRGRWTCSSRSGSASPAPSSRWRSPTSAWTRSRSPARRRASSPTPFTARRRSSRCRAHRIHEALDEDRIVLVAGFQGVSTDFDITTLGRGGSDTTAVALAAALGADACEIYTDVDGVFTADPRLVPGARKLHAVSYEEMLEMAASGAKVLALRSVEFARNHGVKLHVRSTFTGEEGTWITEEDERMLEKAMISGVTHTLEEAVYRVSGTDRADLFDALADAAVSVDTIIQTGDDIVFSAPIEDRAATEAALGRLDANWRSGTTSGR